MTTHNERNTDMDTRKYDTETRKQLKRAMRSPALEQALTSARLHNAANESALAKRNAENAALRDEVNRLTKTVAARDAEIDSLKAKAA